MKNILIFSDFIFIFTEHTKNQDFSRKCLLLSHLCKFTSLYPTITIWSYTVSFGIIYTDFRHKTNVIIMLLTHLANFSTLRENEYNIRENYVFFHENQELSMWKLTVFMKIRSFLENGNCWYPWCYVSFTTCNEIKKSNL